MVGMLGMLGFEEVTMVVSEDKVGMVDDEVVMVVSEDKVGMVEEEVVMVVSEEDEVDMVDEEVDMVVEDVVHSIKTLEKRNCFWM